MRVGVESSTLGHKPHSQSTQLAQEADGARQRAFKLVLVDVPAEQSQRRDLRCLK